MRFENLQGELLPNYPLARQTSWRVGGYGQLCYRPTCIDDLSQFLNQIETTAPVTWLGLGSNVLIRDGGIDGVIILTLNCLKHITLINDTTIRAEAGVTCAKLAKYCVKYGFEEGAFFAGIPGTVGGALVMNAGAFGGQTWEHVKLVEMMNRNGKVLTREPQAFNVSYREVERPANEYFIAGLFEFQRGNIEAAKRNLKSLLNKRNTSQPIGTFSCGSVFRNPAEDYAARLVEASGLKGYQHGHVCVSDKHANFILNNGQASATEIENLIIFVQQEVYRQQGVKLTPEVHIIGKTL